MNCFLKIQSGIQRTKNAKKWLKKDGKKLLWGWEHPLRTDCIACRPGLTLEGTSKKTILLIDVACPNEYNKVAQQDEKIGKDHVLNYMNNEKVISEGNSNNYWMP